MRRISQEQLIRMCLTGVILLGGLALLPFIEMPAQAITWQALAGIYEPTLTVNEPVGAPGSVFAFTGSDYPANVMAVIYVDGDPLGTVMTDAVGGATFMIDTTGSEPGHFDVTLEVDMNASATAGFDLELGADDVTPPPGFEGPTFLLVDLGESIYLPLVRTE